MAPQPDYSGVFADGIGGSMTAMGISQSESANVLAELRYMHVNGGNGAAEHSLISQRTMDKIRLVSCKLLNRL